MPRKAKTKFPGAAPSSLFDQTRDDPRGFGKPKKPLSSTAPTPPSTPRGIGTKGKKKLGKKSKKKEDKDDPSQLKLKYGDREKIDLESTKPMAGTLVEEDKTENELDKHLDYILFPNILGWYFDGYFDTPFGLNEKYANHFNKLQAEYDEKEDYEHEETFTEKVYRNFWPPKYKMGFFRTRGVYLDFPEVIADPPKTPPDINYEHKREPIGIVGDEMEGYDDYNQKTTTTAQKKEMLATKQKELRKKMRKIPLDLEDRPAWIDPSGWSANQTKLKTLNPCDLDDTYKNKLISWTSSDYTVCERRINLERPCRMDNF